MAFPRQAVDLQGSGLTAGCRHWLLLSSRGELDTQRGVTRQGVAVAGVYPAKVSKREAHSLGGLMGVVGVGEARRTFPYGMRCVRWRSNCSRIYRQGHIRGVYIFESTAGCGIEITSARPARYWEQYAR
jgi:hypothetical protein